MTSRVFVMIVELKKIIKIPVRMTNLEMTIENTAKISRNKIFNKLRTHGYLLISILPLILGHFIGLKYNIF